MLDMGGWDESHQWLRTVERRNAFQFHIAQGRISSPKPHQIPGCELLDPSILRLVEKLVLPMWISCGNFLDVAPSIHSWHKNSPAGRFGNEA
jgi:hypothetical protein